MVQVRDGPGLGGAAGVLRGQEGHHGAAGAGEATDTLFVPSPEEAAEDARDAVQVVDPAAVVEVEGVEQERLQHLLPAGQ